MAPEWDYDRRRAEGDFGDATFVTTKELRANLAEVLNRVAYGGEQIVVKRHGKPFVAIVATYDLQACQALEDYSDASEWAEAEAAGEFDDKVSLLTKSSRSTNGASDIWRTASTCDRRRTASTSGSPPTPRTRCAERSSGLPRTLGIEAWLPWRIGPASSEPAP